MKYKLIIAILPCLLLEILFASITVQNNTKVTAYNVHLGPAYYTTTETEKTKAAVSSLLYNAIPQPPIIPNLDINQSDVIQYNINYNKTYDDQFYPIIASVKTDNELLSGEHQRLVLNHGDDAVIYVKNEPNAQATIVLKEFDQRTRSFLGTCTGLSCKLYDWKKSDNQSKNNILKIQKQWRKYREKAQKTYTTEFDKQIERLQGKLITNQNQIKTGDILVVRKNSSTTPVTGHSHIVHITPTGYTMFHVVFAYKSFFSKRHCTTFRQKHDGHIKLMVEKFKLQKIYESSSKNWIHGFFKEPIENKTFKVKNDKRQVYRINVTIEEIEQAFESTIQNAKNQHWRFGLQYNCHVFVNHILSHLKIDKNKHAIENT